MNPGGVVVLDPAKLPTAVYMPVPQPAAAPRSASPPPIQVEDQLPQPEMAVKPEPLTSQPPSEPPSRPLVENRHQHVIVIIQREPAPTAPAAPQPAPVAPQPAPAAPQPALAPLAVVSSVPAPTPAPVLTTQQPTTQRTWKHSEIYYSTEGPFPGGQNSGVLAYFNPSQMQ